MRKLGISRISSNLVSCLVVSHTEESCLTLTKLLLIWRVLRSSIHAVDALLNRTQATGKKNLPVTEDAYCLKSG